LSGFFIGENIVDRILVYSGAIPLETDLLKTNQNTMIAIAKLSSAMFGSSTIVSGLTVTAQSPAAMAVNVSAGEIYELANLEATAYSSLAADTTHSIMKQGISLNPQTLTITAPGTVGYSINYLIQATYQDSDSNAATLPYYNSSNPSQAWSGPNNSGTQQYTTRSGAVVVSAKAGVAATTGSQATPSPDSGYAGLYVVTVAYGATTITASNISQYQGAPLLPAGLLQSMQTGATNYAADSGTAANVYKVNLTPAVTTLVDGMEISFQPNYTNSGASTLSVNGLTAYPVVGGALSALQGGEIPAAGKVKVKWHAASLSYIVTASTGPRQVANAVQSQHAVPLGMFSGVFASSGYMKFPGVDASGTKRTFIFQWMSISDSSSGARSLTITLPITFPNSCLRSWAIDNGSGCYALGSQPASTSQIYVYLPAASFNGSTTPTASAAFGGQVFAIGY
jgi:hypothetical protein